MKLLAVRHGVTSWNAEQRWQGVTDVPLSTQGVTQAIFAARNLSNWGWSGGQVFCSNLSRALLTAQTICKQLNAPPPKIVSDLRERDLGGWEGMAVDDINLTYPGQIDAWKSDIMQGPPGGESDIQVAARFYGACEAVRRAVSPVHPVLIVTHAGVLHAVDKVNGLKYVQYGALAGRWFQVTADHDGVAPGEVVDLLTAHTGSGTAYS